jgi:Zn-dependent protease
VLKNIGFLALLFKLAPLGMKFLKSAKFIKVALAGGSMVAYSYLFTWEFALILLLAIVFHEYGHIQGMKHCGMKTKGIFLIPFVGGAAVPEEQFKNRRDETYVALMGPFYGLLLCIPFLVFGIVYESPLAIGLVSFMALINLFNLFPINPLDGGRVVKCVSFSIHSGFGFFILVLGFLSALFLIYYYQIWILVFVLAIGGLELLFEWSSHFKRFKIKDKNTILQEVCQTNNVDIHSVSEDEKEAVYSKYKQDLIALRDSKNMQKSDIFKYSFYWILLSGLFIGLIFYTGSFEGADLALRLIKDDMG